MPKCVYCTKTYEFPRGLTFVTKDGTVLYFCSSKCRKNYFLRRRKVRWLPKDLKFNPKNKIKAKKKR